MSKKDFYTTGDVAQLLSISRATVSRKFDAGLLDGKKNPITGERLISRNSLLAFMRKYKLDHSRLETASVKQIMLGTQDDYLRAFITDFVEKDEHFSLRVVDSGYDLLVQCSTSPPDLLLVDVAMSNFCCTDAVQSFKKLSGQKPFPILCFLPTQDPEKVMSIDADDFIYKDTLSPDGLIDKVMHLLGIGRSDAGRVFDHKRNWPRIPVNVPVHLVIFSQDKPAMRQIGTARMENVSVGGAYLTKIRIDGGSIPSDPFRFRFTVDTPPLKNMQAECQVVRLRVNGALTAGVQFLNLTDQNRERITRLMSRT